MELSEMIEWCNAKALESKLLPDEDSFYRSLCRKYSKRFHTALPSVEALDPMHVILAVYEDQMEDIDLEDVEALNKLMDIIMTKIDPEYEGQKAAELDEFMEAAQEEEEQRLEDNTPLLKALSKKKPKTAPRATQAPKELPKQGGLNLSYLADSENES